MKKTNKGFSLVELIIVIAIMAILAGALAPALIKYINKSRASSAVSNAQQIASAIQTALSNESVFDNASDYSTNTYSALLTTGAGASNGSLAAELKRTLGTSTQHKCKKTLAGTTISNKDYYVRINLQPSGTDDMVTVWISNTKDTYQAYPTVGSEWQD